MTKRKTIFVVVVVCFLMALLPAQARRSNASRSSSDAERRRKLSDTQKQREAAKSRAAKQSQLEGEQRLKPLKGRAADAKREFLYEKRALASAGITEEQWKLIKAKLERVRQLRDKARCTVGLFLTSSNASGQNPQDARSESLPTWQWKIGWQDKAPNDLTEAQKDANSLMKLVDSRNPTAREFEQAMDSLRKSRDKQKELEEELSRAREELRERLTTRQEAALVLMGWL